MYNRVFPPLGRGFPRERPKIRRRPLPPAHASCVCSSVTSARAGKSSLLIRQARADKPCSPPPVHRRAWPQPGRWPKALYAPVDMWRGSARTSRATPRWSLPRVVLAGGLRSRGDYPNQAAAAEEVVFGGAAVVDESLGLLSLDDVELPASALGFSPPPSLGLLDVEL